MYNIHFYACTYFSYVALSKEFRKKSNARTFQLYTCRNLLEMKDTKKNETVYGHSVSVLIRTCQSNGFSYWPLSKLHFFQSSVSVVRLAIDKRLNYTFTRSYQCLVLSVSGLKCSSFFPSRCLNLEWLDSKWISWCLIVVVGGGDFFFKLLLLVFD